MDSAGNAYVAGTTESADFPVSVGPGLAFSKGDEDAFVAKVKADGTGFVYAGYLGGRSYDYATGIAVDSAGHAYVTGLTSSSDFPVTVGPDLTYRGDCSQGVCKSDAFVAKVKVDGTGLVYAGYLGGRLEDWSSGIAVDSAGNAYVTGTTLSDNFPVVIGPDSTFNYGGSDAFVTKVNADGTWLVYSGYLGGSEGDSGNAIAVDSAGNAYVVGTTNSKDFPATVGPDLTYHGAFVAKIGASSQGNDPPDTAIVGGPSIIFTSNSPKFTWTGADDLTPMESLQYAYRLDPLESSFSTFGSATSRSYTGLPNGSYTFYVKARDETGSEDPTPASRSFTVSVAPPSGDFNGDGKPDLLWRNQQTGEAYVWFLNGTTHTNGESVGQGVDPLWRLAGTGDFNSDGKADLLWQHRQTGEVYVWFMNGTDHSGGQSLGAVPDTQWRIVGVADFNGDQKPDVLWQHRQTGEIYVWFLNGTIRTGGLYFTSVPDIDWRIVGVGDFNYDGKPDLLWQHRRTREVYLWFTNGSYRTGGQSLGTVADRNWEIVGLIDVNSNGNPNLLWRNRQTGEVYVWFMNGTNHTGGQSLGTVIDPSWHLIGETDPVSPDILWYNQQTREEYIWFMNGATHTGGQTVSISTMYPPTWRAVGVGDFNGNGKADIVARNQKTGEVNVSFVDGAVTPSYWTLSAQSVGTVADLNWVIVGVADFNTDGQPDLLWRNQQTGEVYVWFMNGTTRIGGQSLGTVEVTSRLEISGVGDFNGDGKPDILWRNVWTGEVSVWLMDGTIQTGTQSLAFVHPTWRIAGVADFNDDGNPDLLWENASSGEVYVWFMDGTTRIGGQSVGTVPDLNWQIILVGDFGG